MRVLFSCTAAHGHFLPLVPLARAFAAEGHDVAFATAHAFGPRVEAAGFELLPAGLSQREVDARFAPWRRRLLDRPIPERRPLSLAWRFGMIDAPAKLDELRDAIERWRPALVVHDATDLAAPVAAAAGGLPSVHHSFGRMIPLSCLERAASEVDVLWRRVGLDPSPLCGVFRGPYVDICPPSLQGPDTPPSGTVVEPLRPEFPPARDDAPPAWLDELPERPTVYLTLGTIFNDATLFRVLLAGVEGHDVNAVLTVGRDGDPRALGPLPPNVTVERYVAQAYLLPRCTAVVSHGGSGSLLASLAAGVPSVLVPQGADQFENAERCHALGTAVSILPQDLTAAALREAVGRVLRDPAFSERAAALATEIAALPDAGTVARRLAAAEPR